MFLIGLPGQLSGVVMPWPFELSRCADGPGRPIDTPQLEGALAAQGIEMAGTDRCSGGDVAQLEDVSAESNLFCIVRWQPEGPVAQGLELEEWDLLRGPGTAFTLGNVDCAIYMHGDDGPDHTRRLRAAFKTLERSLR